MKLNIRKLKFLGGVYLTFLKLGTVSFGGGYAIVPLLEKEVVEEKKWVNREKIVDILAISQSLPGAIALNSSAFVGFSIAGIPGALAALLGNLTSPVVIVLLLSLVFATFRSLPAVRSAFHGIYPAIVSMVAFAAYKIGKTSITDVVGFIVMVLAFGLSTFLDLPPIPLIIAGALLGIAISAIKPLLVLPKAFNDDSEGRNL